MPDGVDTTNAPAREEADILAAIFARVSEGQATSTAVDAEGMARATFWRRVAALEDVRGAYEAALAARAHVYAEEIVEISDVEPPMVGDTNHKAGESRIDSGAVAWQKLRVDSRKWVISKLLPKKYGEKIDHTLAGADGGPVQHKVTVEYIDAPAGGIPLPAAAQS